MTVTITLPWAYLVPDNVRHGLVGRTIRLTARYRDAQQALHLAALAGWRAAGRRGPLEGPLAIDVLLVAPDRRRRDVSNYAKIIGDALAGVAWHDDAQIADARYRRGPVDPAAPCAVLTVRPMEAA